MDDRFGPSSTALEFGTSMSVVECFNPLAKKPGEGMLPGLGDLPILSDCAEPLDRGCTGMSTDPSLAAAASAATLTDATEKELFLRFMRCAGLMVVSDAAECKCLPLEEFLAGRL